MKLVRWNGEGQVTDNIIHYMWEPGTVYKVRNNVADLLLTNSDFSVIDEKNVIVDDTPDAALEEEAPEYSESV